MFKVFLVITLLIAIVTSQITSAQPFDDLRVINIPIYFVPEVYLTSEIAYFTTVEQFTTSVTGILIVTRTTDMSNSTKIQTIETIYSQYYPGFTLSNSTATHLGDPWNFVLPEYIYRSTQHTIMTTQSQTITGSGSLGTLYGISWTFANTHFIMTLYTTSQLCANSIEKALNILIINA
jgi:hypothetical protein